VKNYCENDSSSSNMLDLNKVKINLETHHEQQHYTDWQSNKSAL
jgi:hypothetical protein